MEHRPFLVLTDFPLKKFSVFNFPKLQGKTKQNSPPPPLSSITNKSDCFIIVVATENERENLLPEKEEESLYDRLFSLPKIFFLANGEFFFLAM